MINIFKIGSNILNNPIELDRFLTEFKETEGKKILVHGGGKEATLLGEKLGVKANMIDGRRVTDKATLDIVTMVYAGLINKQIVSLLQDKGCNAVGLSGADGKVLQAVKRSPEPVDYGYVGDLTPEMVNLDFISLLLDNGYVPVFSAICRNVEGGLLNCNADSVANVLSQACVKLDKVNLIFCFEMEGVLEDINNPESLIPVITPPMFSQLKQSGKISGGMIPKVYNALKAIEAGVNTVRISRTVIRKNEE